MGGSAAAKKSAGRSGTPVPYPDDMKPVKPWDMIGEPGDDSGEGTKHFGIDVSDSESAFLEWLAAFRNAMAKAKGKKLRRQWTRKTIAESLLSKRLVDEREEFRELLEAVGPFPNPKDDDEMLRYAKAVVAWSEKSKK